MHMQAMRGGVDLVAVKVKINPLPSDRCRAAFSQTAVGLVPKSLMPSASALTLCY